MQTIQKKLEAEKMFAQINFQNRHNQWINSFLKDQQIKLYIDYISLNLQDLDFTQISLNSATQISKLVFQPELKQVEQYFKGLPSGECSLPQFIIIMFKVLKVTIQKSPYVIIGLREMFISISAGKKFIDYNSFFKYMIGQVVSVKQIVNNTEFQIRYTQNKKQDYLFHDRGIKKVYYSKQLKVVICLDKFSNQLKFYDKQMKLFTRFTTNKDKHEGKHLGILQVGFCQIYNRLGLILEDNSVSVINLKQFITQDILEFQANPINELVLKHNQIMEQIYYLEMWGKWIAVSEKNQIFKFDFERSKPEQRIEHIHIHIGELKIKEIIQFPNLNLVAVIAGNQVIFYNENLSIKQYSFSHGCDITTLRYSEFENQFYTCGRQNTITIFERDKNLQQFKVKIFQTAKTKLTNFEVFAQVGVLVAIDQHSEVKLYEYNKKILNQHQNFKSIKKNAANPLGLLKISKNQFCLYETYMLMFTLEKVAIQTSAEIKFTPYYYYNPIRQLFYISLNNQILTLHLLRGLVQDEYTPQNSNIGKHIAFFLGQSTHIFQIDQNCNIFDVYLNDEIIEGENRNYKRKLYIGTFKDASYHEQSKTLAIWSEDKIYQLLNQDNNNFVILNVFEFQNKERIRDLQFCTDLCLIKLCTNKGIIYKINMYNLQIIERYQYQFKYLEKRIDEQDVQILNYLDFTEYKLEIIFCSNNSVIIIQPKKIQIIKLENYVKFRNNQQIFIKMKYQELKLKKKIKKIEKEQDIQKNVDSLLVDDEKNYSYQLNRTLFFLDQSGYVITLEISNLFADSYPEKSELIRKNIEASKQGYTKGNRIFQQKKNYKQIVITKEMVTQCKRIKNSKIWKAHDKEIIQIVNIQLQKLVTLSYSNDGFIKLWNENLSCLFSLKMPNFFKFHWNMQEIEKSKSFKNIEKIRKVIKYFQYKIKQSHERESITAMIHRSRHFKKNNPYSRINIFDPFTIDVQNREVEDFMNKTQIFQNTIRKLSSQDKRHKKRQMNSTLKSNGSPWKKNPHFAQFIQNIDKKHKHEKIPLELQKLRLSLDVRKRDMSVQDLKVSALPILQGYTPEPRMIEVKQKKKETQQQSNENFEACLYVKKKRLVNRANKFDEIDKQFQRKRFKNIKYINNFGVIKVNKKQQVHERQLKKQGKGELIDNLKKIFEQHNRQVILSRKGRIISIPKLKQFHKQQTL